MIGVVRNFTFGVDTSTGVLTAWFDAYYDEGQSIPVTISSAHDILKFLNAAGLLSAPHVDGTPCVLNHSSDPPVFVRAANL